MHCHEAVVLAGELVAGQGRASDFYRLGSRLSARRTLSLALKRAETPLTFVGFDVLWIDGSTTDLLYMQRRELLEDLGFNGDAWVTTPVLRGTMETIIEVCAEYDLEGVVAKRMTSKYVPGHRSAHWVKVKTADWREHHAPLRHEPHRPDSTGSASARPRWCPRLLCDTRRGPLSRNRGVDHAHPSGRAPSDTGRGRSDAAGSPEEVVRWAKAGHLHPIRTIGGHRRYREAGALALLTESRADRVSHGRHLPAP